MEPTREEKFAIDRHATIGDAADRRVPERGMGVHHAAEQLLPLMRDAVIGRKTAMAMIVMFLLLIVIHGTWAVIAQLRPKSPLRENWSQRESPEGYKAITAGFLEDSAPSKWMRQTWGTSLSHLTGDRVANVMFGKDGFLFYLPDFEACMSKPILAPGSPDVVSNIVEYDKALRSRGIHLVLLPVPTKTAIIPFELDPNYPRAAGPASNSDYEKWIATLQSQGVDVVDMTDEFWKLAVSGNIPYQTQDSHWTPQAMELTAKRLAEHVTPWLGSYARKQYATHTETIVAQGDLVGLLGLVGDFKHWPPMALVETQVLIDGKSERAPDDSDVLVLGDSYTEMGMDKRPWSLGSAGLPAHLMLDIGADVQYIAGSGALFSGSREALQKQPLTLRNKKVVVWEFTSRYLPIDSIALPDRRE